MSIKYTHNHTRRYELSDGSNTNQQQCNNQEEQSIVNTQPQQPHPHIMVSLDNKDIKSQDSTEVYVFHPLDK